MDNDKRNVALNRVRALKYRESLKSTLELTNAQTAQETLTKIDVDIETYIKKNGDEIIETGHLVLTEE